jgi:hypothetical protein
LGKRNNPDHYCVERRAEGALTGIDVFATPSRSSSNSNRFYLHVNRIFLLAIAQALTLTLNMLAANTHAGMRSTCRTMHCNGPGHVEDKSGGIEVLQQWAPNKIWCRGRYAFAVLMKKRQVYFQLIALV